MTTQSTDGISFGPLFLDTASRRLMRDGRRVSVSPIELKLLETLLRNRDRVLTGDELRILVWADDPATDTVPSGDANALYVAIRKLRKSLGNCGKWIVNIPKVGYTIAEDVEVNASEAQIHSSSDARHPFVGRQAELKRLKELLTTTRLITLTGPPGIGKSRLASKLAEEIVNNYPDGIYSANFVGLENETLAPKAVLRALDLSEDSDRSVMEAISEHLKEKLALLIFDNCDHLVDACSEIVDRLLRAAPKIQVIIASREPLLLPDELVMAVPPLSIPPATPAPGSNGSCNYDAAELFITLAKQRRADFEIEKKDMPLVGELCRRLEGIPLAIELAAVQVGAYTVEQIIDVTSDRFRLLRRRGGEDARHNTLEAAVDWSYDLLNEDERTFLRRLSVFTGQWASESARAICAGDGVEESEVVHLLAQLVRRSLIQLSGVRGHYHYGMLETIRQFGRERLRESGEEDIVVERHDRYFLHLAENSFEAGVKGDWLVRLEAEYDNVRSVLERSIRQGRSVETGLRMCGALAKFWFNYGHVREARWWTQLALDADNGRSPDASAGAFRTAGFFFGQMADSSEDSERGKAYFEQSLAIWRELGDEKQEAFTLGHYSFLLNRLGMANEAREAAQRSLEICTAAGDHADVARSMNNIAVALLDTGETSEAKPVFERALSEARMGEDRYLEAVCLHNLGEIAARMGELEYAENHLADSLGLFKAIGNRPLFARTLLLQGEVATLKNQTSEAMDLERAALEEFCEIGDSEGIASALEAIAVTHVKTGANPTLFLTLNSAAAELRRKIRLQIGPARKGPLQQLTKKATASLGKIAAGSAIEIGKTMSIGEAVEAALKAE